MDNHMILPIRIFLARSAHQIYPNREGRTVEKDLIVSFEEISQ